jgi:virulence-associated protein VagC
LNETSETREAQIFENGASQAARPQAESGFEGNKVDVTRNDAPGNAVLSTQPGENHGKAFFELVHAVLPPDAAFRHFSSERPMNVLPGQRGVFDSETNPA